MPTLVGTGLHSAAVQVLPIGMRKLEFPEVALKLRRVARTQAVPRLNEIREWARASGLTCSNNRGTRPLKNNVTIKRGERSTSKESLSFCRTPTYRRFYQPQAALPKPTRSGNDQRRIGADASLKRRVAEPCDKLELVKREP